MGLELRTDRHPPITSQTPYPLHHATPSILIKLYFFTLPVITLVNVWSFRLNIGQSHTRVRSYMHISDNVHYCTWIQVLPTPCFWIACSSRTTQSSPGPSGQVILFVHVEITLCFRLFWTEGNENVKPVNGKLMRTIHSQKKIPLKDESAQLTLDLLHNFVTI